MRYAIVLLMMLITFNTAQAGHKFHIHQGKWISQGYYHKVININAKHYGLKVKGLKGHKSMKFERVSRNVFRDCYGNTAKLISPVKMMLVKRGSHRPIVFRKTNSHNHNNYGSSCSICENDRDHYYEYRNDHDKSSSYGDYLYDRHESVGERIEGNWKVRNSGDTIEVLWTRDGIKVRLNRVGDWRYYSKNEGRGTSYRDFKGNQYIVKGDNDMVWLSFDGKREIRLQR